MSNGLNPNHYTAKCRYFIGIMNDCCKAGVRYEDVKDKSATPYKYPCITPSITTCDKVDRYTKEESAKMVAEHDARLEQMLKDLSEGKCPHCHAVVKEEIQVGRCVYAKPCGHRLGQGTAKKVRRV